MPSSSRNDPPTLPATVSAEFSNPQPQQQFACLEKETGSKPTHSIRRLDVDYTDPGKEKRTLVLDYFLPKTGEKHPVVVILPMLGGSYPLERYFANYFSKRGFASIIVHREKLRKDAGLEDLDGMIKNSILENRRAIDWIETRPELDAQRIGVFGISMGAIKGAFLTPIEPRIRAACLGLAAGDLPYLLTYSTEKGIARRREAIMREEGITIPELHQKLAGYLHCDPQMVAPFADPKKVLMVFGAFDTVVPINKGLELRNAMGKPETVIVPSGHYSSILFVPYIQSQCYKFFKKKLLTPDSHRLSPELVTGRGHEKAYP